MWKKILLVIALALLFFFVIKTYVNSQSGIKSALMFTEVHPQRYLVRGDSLNVVFEFANMLDKEVSHEFIIRFSAIKDGQSVDHVLDNMQLKAGPKEKVKFSKYYPVDFDFDEGIIFIEDLDSKQYLSFKLKNVNKYIAYQGYGQGNLDCVPYINETRNKGFVIYAHGTEAEGYPILQVWIDGSLHKEFYLDSETKSFAIDVPDDENPEHIIDLMYINDKEIAGKDRNLIIDKIVFGEKTINNFLVDEGKLENAIDCEDIFYGNELTREGSIRFIIA